MTPDEARQNLLLSQSDEEPTLLTTGVLSKLTVDDVPEGASFQVGTAKGGGHHLEWSGTFYRVGDVVCGEADLTWTRKYWYSPIGLEQYMDLVRRTVETRQRLRADVAIANYDDDGAYVVFRYRIFSDEKVLSRLYDDAVRVSVEVAEAAEQAADEVGQLIAQVASRLSGWGAAPLDSLVEAVETAKSTDEKGRTLEELCSRLFASVPGFSVTQRIRTETEEIDISVINGSQEPWLHREQAFVIAECKNWSGKCGKNEFVIFREKMENRNRRCSLGFLISWNGFAETVTKEMLRGSREDILVVPLAGKDIREAVRDADFLNVLQRSWEKALSL